MAGYGVADFVGGDLAQRWRATGPALDAFLNKNGLKPEDQTTAMLIRRLPVEAFQAAQASIATDMSEGEEWAVLSLSPESGERTHGLIFPAKNLTRESVDVAPYIDTHSRMVAWWLCSAWRSQELARITWQLGDQYSVTAACAVARALLETAAAVWVDATGISKLWDTAKQAGRDRKTIVQGWQSLSLALWRMEKGGKFNDRTPDLQRAWKDLEKRNVLSDVDKLAKVVVAYDLQVAYQWLCNTVHPSVGATLTFSSPTLIRNDLSHTLTSYAPYPLAIHSGDARVSESTVQEAILTCAISAVRVLISALDDALRVIDDVALTTGAPRLASFKYWRQITVGPPSQPCPCRSGRPSGFCAHQWGEKGPEVRRTFEQC